MVKHTLFFIFMTLNGVFAQTSISGSITDMDNGKPLIGANILLKGTTMGAATDVKGSYTIPNVPAGSYILILSPTLLTLPLHRSPCKQDGWISLTFISIN